MAIKAIIWDMGGVLLRTETMQPRIELAADMGVSYSFLNELIFSSDSSLQSETGEISNRIHWQNIAEELGLPGETADELRDRWFSGDQVDSTLINYIESLRKCYRTGLLSNAWEGTRDFVGNKYFFLNVFDRVLFSYEVGVRKPDPHIFEMMLSILEVQPEEAVFIDDFEKNILGAQKVGIHALQFMNTPQIMQGLNQILQI